MRERFRTALIFVEIASAIVLLEFALFGMFALIGAHKNTEIVVLYGVLSALIAMLFMGLMAGLMWIIYRRAIRISTIRSIASTGTNAAPPTPSY
jgi:hypothetical protein